MRFLLPLSLLLSLLLSGCSLGPTKQPDTIDKKIAYAEEMAQQGFYEDARKSWESVRDAYVSTEMTQLAEFKVGEVYFLAEEFVEATAAYKAFLESYPTSARREEAMFRLGVCYERQMKGPERDQSITQKALETFTRFLQQYPASPRRVYAEQLIDRCNSRLAAHEVVIARYYMNRGNYNAAIARLAYVVQNYPHYPERTQVADLLEKAENRGLGETRLSQVMDRLYNLVIDNETVRDMRSRIMDVFKPI